MINEKLSAALLKLVEEALNDNPQNMIINLPPYYKANYGGFSVCLHITKIENEIESLESLYK